MALTPEDYLSTPANYATPQQLDSVRQIAAALMKPQTGQMQSWTQPASQIVNALLGVKMMQQANARDQMLTRGLSMGGPVPATMPSPSQAGNSGNDPLASGDDYTAASNYVKQAEGFDPVSKWDYHQYTSGYGTKEPGGGGIPISQDEAQRRFDGEFGPTYQAVKQRFPNANSNQVAALASLTHNAGPGWMNGSGLSQAVDAGDWPTAARHMLSYNQAGGRPNPELAQRRQVDAQMLLSGGKPTQTAEGGSVRMDVPPSVAAAGMSFGSPSSPAGAQTQPPVSPTGQGPQLTPGASTSPQMPNGAGASPSAQGPTNQFNEYIPRGAVRVTPEVPLERIQALYALRSPEALKLASELQQQNVQRALPQTIPYQGGQIVIPDPINHPEQQMFMRGAPVIQRGKAGDTEAPIGSTYTDQYGQTHVQPLIQDQPAGGPSTPGVSFTQGGSGALPDSPRPTLGGLAEFGTQLKRQEAEAQAQGTETGKLYANQAKGFKGAGLIFAQQKPNYQILQAIANDDHFWSGAGGPAALTLQRIGATMGLNQDQMSAAAPRELFNMVSARVLADTFSGLRSLSSEAGEQASRIFKSFLELEEKANITDADSRDGIKLKLAMLSRSADRAIDWANKVYDYEDSHGGNTGPGFMKSMMNEIAGTKLLSPSEEQDLGKIIGKSREGYPAPSDAAVQYLKTNPNTRNFFEQKYGASAAEKALRGQ